MIAGAILLALTVLPVAPDDPSSTSVQWVTTDHGAVLVWDDCGDSTAGVDPDPLRATIDEAYARGERENPDVAGLPLTGTIVFLTDQVPSELNGSHVYWNGVSLIRLRCGYPHVLKHELAHRFAEQLELPCARHLIHHPEGADLSCEIP